jgi:hypothetical protein
MPRLPLQRATLQPSLNLSHDHLDRDCVVPAAWDYHVGVALARLDKLEVHRLHRRKILLDYLVERAAAHARVALDAPNEPDVRVRVDKHLYIAQLPHALIDEEKYPVDDDHIGGLAASRCLTPQVRDEVVFGFIDRASIAQGAQVSAEKIIVERVGMIPVEPLALVE